MDNSKSQGQSSFRSLDYFKNTEGKAILNAKGIIDIGGEKVSITIQVRVRRVVFDGSDQATLIGNSPSKAPYYTQGEMYNGQTSIISFSLAHPNGNVYCNYCSWILTAQKDANKVYNRFK